MKTNLNDGNWHNILISRRPESIHPESTIEYVWHDRLGGEAGVLIRKAGKDERGIEPAWGQIIRIRVVKVHRDPRDLWVAFDCKGNVWETATEKPVDSYGFSHFREVINVH